VRQFVLAESVGPAIRLVIAPPAKAGQLAKDRDAAASAQPSPSGSEAASGSPTGSQPLEVVSQPAIQTSSGGDARVGTRKDDSDTATDAARSDASAAGAPLAAEEGGTAKVARADAKGRHEGNKHHGHRARSGRKGHGDRLHGRSAAGTHRAHAGQGHHSSGRASAAHTSHGSSHHVRSHASWRSPKAAHRQGSAKHNGHKHAKKDH
jgi:hypothetical protein